MVATARCAGFPGLAVVQAGSHMAPRSMLWRKGSSTGNARSVTSVVTAAAFAKHAQYAAT